MSATTTHQGLPEGMQPFALLDVIESLRSELGLIDQDITYLRWVFRRVKSEDFVAGRICAVWMSVANLAVELGFNTRKIHRIEARLQRCGVILKTSLSNGRRYGRRSQGGQIVRAAGISLAPAINRASELVHKLRQSRLSMIDVRDDQDRARDLIHKIRSLGSDEAITAAKTAFPRLRPSEIQQQHRLTEIIEALEAVLSDFSAVGGRTIELAPSDTSDRPSTITKKIIKTCSEPKPKQLGKLHTTATQVRLLASEGFAEAIDLYSEGFGEKRTLTWKAVTMAASDRARNIGITGDQWANGCRLVGEVNAALGLMLVDRNSERSGVYHVENIAAAFEGMMRKEARETAVIERLTGELSAFVKRASAQVEPER